MDDQPEHLTSWRLEDWTPAQGAAGQRAAHPNSRYCTPMVQCPVLANEWGDPAGVPISAILFGGRRASTIPLVNEAFDWQHGVFLGSIMGSETTAAATGKVGIVRRDPFAMLPFCGYNMADYWAHWLKIGERKGAQLPKIFFVNWFRKDADGKFLWPGFGDNSRVLKWVFERVSGQTEAVDTPIGRLPAEGAIDTEGLTLDEAQTAELLRVDVEGWRKEIPDIEDFYNRFGDRVPDALRGQLAALDDRLAAR
jgi:phosphoenolpyruvate carboxykinase (GTP)